MMTGFIVSEAFRAFDRWRDDHDPDRRMSEHEAAIAYYNWAETNSIAPYLDPAAPQANAENDRG